MAIPVGTAAPAFTLKSKTADGIADINLADHLGKDVVVLLFFPGAFTGVCTTEMCNVSEGVHNLSGAITYGISKDSPFAQGGWAEAKGIKTTLLADTQLIAAELYDVVLEDFIGLGPATKRAAFVIGKDGNVVYSEETPTPGDMPNFEAISAAVKEAIG
ncbi:MAG TPA: redoxin domain-containing protein [Fimbriimonas sp.]|nr:redoxin domain-containing protein [Fimbriimonas sp.]